jgi:hypothetical protein
LPTTKETSEPEPEAPAVEEPLEVPTPLSADELNALAGDELLAAAQARSGSHLTRELLAEAGLDDEYLRAVAAGLLPGPPNIGPNPTVDLHYTDGGWQVTPKGVAPADVGRTQVGQER